MNRFIEMSSQMPQNPVIFLFDNETKNKHPLNKFLNEIKSKNDLQDLLLKQCYISLPDTKNLYLVTNPLVKGKDECEIEDLFTEEALTHEMSDKNFSREDKIDNKTCYGKNYFSLYILNHYQDINFSNFRPMLNALVSIQKDYAIQSFPPKSHQN